MTRKDGIESRLVIQNARPTGDHEKSKKVLSEVRSKQDDIESKIAKPDAEQSSDDTGPKKAMSKGYDDNKGLANRNAVRHSKSSVKRRPKKVESNGLSKKCVNGGLVSSNAAQLSDKAECEKVELRVLLTRFDMEDGLVNSEDEPNSSSYFSVAAFEKALMEKKHVSRKNSDQKNKKPFLRKSIAIDAGNDEQSEKDALNEDGIRDLFNERGSFVAENGSYLAGNHDLSDDQWLSEDEHSDYEVGSEFMNFDNSRNTADTRINNSADSRDFHPFAVGEADGQVLMGGEDYLKDYQRNASNGILKRELDDWGSDDYAEDDDYEDDDGCIDHHEDDDDSDDCFEVYVDNGDGESEGLYEQFENETWADLILKPRRKSKPKSPPIL